MTQEMHKPLSIQNCLVLKVYPDRSRLKLDKVLSIDLGNREIVEWDYPKLGEHKHQTIKTKFTDIKVVKRSATNQPEEVHCHV